MRQATMHSKSEISLESRMLSGIPQYGILSPPLWNLVVKELLGEIVCGLVDYANDLMIIIRGSFMDEVMKITKRIPKKSGDLVCQDWSFDQPINFSCECGVTYVCICNCIFIPHIDLI